MSADALSPERVLAHGRGWVQRLLGGGHAAPVFLVGGVFKMLLHGRPPRDLDLWAPDEAARGLLVDALLRRGAKRVLENPPYQDVFTLGGLRIDVAHDTRHPALETLLGNCDLALSAVGYAHAPEGEHCFIHPLAVESANQRSVLLLRPLVNWKYALYTLERMHRYGQELGYAVWEEEEALVWDTFTAQPVELQRGMIARYQRVSEGVPAILRKAEALLG
jgi:hypothetical protein